MQAQARLLLAGILLLGCGGTGETTRPARIVLLSMDTVRADRVSGYGDADTTPVLAEIASEGVLFRNSYAASTYTIPSHMSVFTGLDAAEHDVVSMNASLAPDVPTLAELLREAGYRTWAFHEGGYVDARFGFDRGFEAYRELRSRSSLVEGALPKVLRWMREAADTPYFLFLHTYAAHAPYGGFERYREEHPERGLPSDEELARLRHVVSEDASLVDPERRSELGFYNLLAERAEDKIANFKVGRDFVDGPHFARDLLALKRSYDERIRHIDRALARIRQTLSDLHQWDDTLLVVFSDHGEAFYEHRQRDHGYVPFDEVLAVPLVFSWPRMLRGRAPRVVETLTWHLDLAPTVLGLAGLAPPGGMRGLDLTPFLVSGAELPSDRVIHPAVLRVAYRKPFPLRRVALQGRHKWIEGHPRFGDPEGLLFDLSIDPGETRNLRASRPEVAERLSAGARDYAAGLVRHPPRHQRTGRPLPPLVGGPAPDLTELQRRKLRELGYVE